MFFVNSHLPEAIQNLELAEKKLTQDTAHRDHIEEESI